MSHQECASINDWHRSTKDVLKSFKNPKIKNQTEGYQKDLKKQPPEVFCQKSVLTNFAKFTGNTCASVSFLIKLLLRTPFLQNHFERLLLYINIYQIQTQIFNQITTTVTIQQCLLVSERAHPLSVSPQEVIQLLPVLGIS